MTQSENSPARLPRDLFSQVVRLTPLVSIDLIVRDEHQRMLLGWRRNQPARRSWFVPGGIIRKNEPLEAAFKRISGMELGIALDRSSARFVGVFEHFYPDNFTGSPDFGTHYVVLAHRLTIEFARLKLPSDQHDDYLWLPDSELPGHPDVHPNSKAYVGL